MPIRSLGLRLRHARKIMRKMTQAQLAKAAGVEQPSISELETGETKEISGPTLLAVSRALGVRAQWLVHGDEPIEPAFGDSINDDEQELLQLYRDSSPQWRLAIKYMAKMRHDKQREKAAAYVLSSIFATPVPDERLGEDWTRPDKK